MAKTKRHPGTIEERGASCRVILYVSGERHAFTLKGASRKEAEAFAVRKDEELQELAKRAALGLPGPMRFSDLLKKYEAEKLPLLAPRSQRSYRGSMDRFREFFVQGRKDPLLSEIRAGHVNEFLTWRRANRRNGEGTSSNRTVAKDRAVLHLLFTYAEELELRDGNPVTRVKPPKVQPRDPLLLTPEQYERLLSETAEHPMLRLYVLVLGETGARCESEALRLKWDDVDLEGGFIFIPSRRGEHRTKSGKGRWVPMTPRLRQAMREHFAAHRLLTYGGKRSPYLLHHTRTRRKAVAGEPVRSFRTSLAKAIRRARLPVGFHVHDLRHRRVTTWLAEGKNPVHVKEAMGHSAMQTTMGYTHLAREHLRSLVDAEPAREQLRDLGT